DGELGDLLQAVVAHTAPGCCVRQAGFACHSAAKLRICFREGDSIAPLSQRTGTFEPRPSRSYHQNARIASFLAHSLPAPPPTPFLTHGRVLGAANGRHHEIPADADIASDAFANVLDAAFLYLSGQKRVGDRGSRSADQVEQSLPDLTHH